MFESVHPATPDPIFGLSEAFRNDPSPHKLNLGVGVYQDAEGRTPVLESVKEAERRILHEETSKSYLPIEGLRPYNQAVCRLVLGPDHPAIAERRALTLQTPGGTGALRLFADLWHSLRPEATLWMSDPTWPNHPAICSAARLATRSYPYFDHGTGQLLFDQMIAALREAVPGDLVLLQGVCHNPTGVDPTEDQWAEIAWVLAERGALPLVDLAYQGFGDGLDEDVQGLRLLARELSSVAVCSSFSKSLGLYRERVGGLTLIASSAQGVQAVASQACRSARALYSNPPCHGAWVAALILEDEELRQLWQLELASMRERISTIRRRLKEELDHRGIQLRPGGNDFIVQQRGLFSFAGLSEDRVRRLREQHSIYMVGNGRINVAGLHESVIPAFCDAIASVL